MPYGVIHRPPDYERIRDGRPEPDRPMQRWVDVSDGEIGIAFLNDGKHGYSSTRTGVSLSLMRAPQIRAGEIAGLGPFEFSYAVLPHVGTWNEAQIPLAAASFNRPLCCQTASRHPGTAAELPSLLNVDPPGVLVGAVKRAERSHNLVVRLHESLGTECTANLDLGRPVGAAYETDALERPLPGMELPVSENGNGCTIPLRPFEVKTIVLQPV
jgi:alpha-mannosidase